MCYPPLLATVSYLSFKPLPNGRGSFKYTKDKIASLHEKHMLKSSAIAQLICRNTNFFYIHVLFYDRRDYPYCPHALTMHK